VNLADSTELALPPPAASLPPAPGPGWLPGGPGPAGAGIAVCYDGCWYRNAARFFVRMRGAELSFPGLHDAFRWHAAAVFGCPVRQVAVTQAHYVAGRDPGASCADWDQVLADHGIIRHDVPVTAGKGEVGADVELALTCWQIACDTRPDMIVLVAGDGDFAPLAARLAGRGLRVLVPRAGFAYPDGPAATTVTTSALLTRRATDTPALLDLIDAAAGPGYPPYLARPLTPIPGPGDRPPARQAARRHGTVSRWAPGARYGFITSTGQTWYAAAADIAGHAALAPGTHVTFTGHATPPPGKLYPRACTVIPQSAGPAAKPRSAPAARTGPDDTAVPGNRLAVPGSPEPGAGKSWLTVIDGAAVTRWREKAGWTRGELARQSGVSITTVSRIEQADHSRCHVQTARRLAQALGQPVTAITAGKPHD
jgi:DNA-binding XRE family transcriptional regulator